MLAELFVRFVSPAVLIRTSFVVVSAPDGATLTVSVRSGNCAPLSTPPEVEHRTCCPFAPQLQPVPTPDTKRSSGGSVSLTVIGPLLTPALAALAMRTV